MGLTMAIRRVLEELEARLEPVAGSAVSAASKGKLEFETPAERFNACVASIG